MSYYQKGQAAAECYSLLACRNKVNTDTGHWTLDTGTGHWTSWATQFFPFSVETHSETAVRQRQSVEMWRMRASRHKILQY